MSEQGMGQFLTEEYGKRMAEDRVQAEQRRADERTSRANQRQAKLDGAEHARRIKADKVAGNAATTSQDATRDAVERARGGMGRYLA